MTTVLGTSRPGVRDSTGQFDHFLKSDLCCPPPPKLRGPNPPSSATPGLQEGQDCEVGQGASHGKSVQATLSICNMALPCLTLMMEHMANINAKECKPTLQINMGSPRELVQLVRHGPL